MVRIESGLAGLRAGDPFPVWHDGVALWLVRLDTWPGALGQGLLSAEELERSRRFRFEHDQRRYVAAHVALRERIGQQLGRSPDGLSFETGVHGKPRLRVAGWHVNLSHSADLALIGLAEGVEIGVDLEVIRPVDDARPLAESVFGPNERRTLAAMSGPARDRAFLQGWTRKEACLKALGTGLSLSPQAFEAGLGDAAVEVVVPTRERPERLAVSSLAPAQEAGSGTPWVGAVARRLFPS